MLRGPSIDCSPVAKRPPGIVEWSQRAGVHGDALREAMVLLTRDGLLNRRSTGGFFVPHPEEFDFPALRDARLATTKDVFNRCDRVELVDNGLEQAALRVSTRLDVFRSNASSLA